jgi:hypothetical protein
MRRSFSALILALVAVLPSGLFARAPFALAVVDSEITTYANQFASTILWQYTLTTITPATGNLLVACFSMANETRTISSFGDDDFLNDFVELGAPGSLTHSTATITASCRALVVPATPVTRIDIELNGAASSNAGMVIYELSGQRIAGAYDARGTGEETGATGANHDASVATAEANEILVGCTTGTAGTYTPDATFSNALSNAFFACGTKAAASATSYTMTNTSANVEDTISILMAFRQEGAAAASPKPLLLLGVGGR